MKLKKRLETFLGKTPQIHETALVASTATVIGDVRLAPYTSIWPHCVLRGDIDYIEVGEGSNIQDSSVVHLANDIPSIIGRYVTIGHMVMVHACTIEDECLIGMHSTILDGALIGRRSIIGAHTLVTKNTIIPPGSMVLGVPGKVVRLLSEEEQRHLRPLAEKYVETAAIYKSHFRHKI